MQLLCEKYFKYPFILYFLVCITACNQNTKTVDTKSNHPFPLSKGNKWTYEANIKYHQRKTDSLIELKMEWTMEVIDTIRHGKYFAAVIKGFPTDLIWYEGKAEKSDLILLQDSNKFYLCTSDSFDTLLKRLRDLNDSLKDLRNSQWVLFDFPLSKGKTWGGDPDMPERSDSMYAWVVKHGATDTSSAEVQYSTNPDHSIFKFQPNIGITGYYFEHHGTIMQLDMKLIKKNFGLPFKF